MTLVNGDEVLLHDMNRSCDITVDKVSKIIEDALATKKTPDLNSWNYDDACNTAANKMIEILKKYTGNEDARFELCLDKINKDGTFTSVACSSTESSLPHITNVVRDIETDRYYDAEYIRNGGKEIVCLMTKEEVRNKYANRDRFDGTDNNIEQYNQVFYVPILCRKIKPIGVLVISCLGETELGKDEKSVREFIQKRICSYISLLIVFYKLEKVLRLKKISRR